MMENGLQEMKIYNSCGASNFKSEENQTTNANSLVIVFIVIYFKSKKKIPWTVLFFLILSISHRCREKINFHHKQYNKLCKFYIVANVMASPTVNL